MSTHLSSQTRSIIRYASWWRIDYQIATPGIAAKAVSAVVERAATHDERWSDHAPVTVTFAD
jgi:exodeoxyribonuclease III